MAKLPTPKSKLSEKDLTKKLAVTTTEEVVAEKPKKGKLVKPVATNPAPAVDTTPEVVSAPAKKVTSIADKKKAKADAKAEATATVTPAVTETTPLKNKEVASKAKPVLEEEGDTDAGFADWDELFDETIEGKNFRYIRQDNMTMPELLANLPKFNVHMLMAEQRDDGKFTNLVMCFISKESITFIDQTGGEDYDSIAQMPHADIIGKRELKVKKASFPFALYIKESK